MIARYLQWFVTLILNILSITWLDVTVASRKIAFVIFLTYLCSFFSIICMCRIFLSPAWFFSNFHNFKRSWILVFRFLSRAYFFYFWLVYHRCFLQATVTILKCFQGHKKSRAEVKITFLFYTPFSFTTVISLHNFLSIVVLSLFKLPFTDENKFMNNYCGQKPTLACPNGWLYTPMVRVPYGHI